MLSVQTIQWNNLDVGELLGHGGYGDVYKATWHGKAVALKQLHLKTLSTTLQEEFMREAEIMAQCQFPNIIGLYGICNGQGHNGLVMEYMAKGSLRSVLENKSENLGWPIRWEIALDIGKGLSYLHEKNILHRDLKSLNVLLDINYHAKICDFGLAKIKLETSSSNSTKSKAGTVRWRAPETFKRGFKPASSMDIYSYGMVLWEIASREIPFSADAPDEITAMGFIKDGEKEIIPSDCPKAYGAEIEKCWQEADKRPAAKEVVANLEQAKPALLPNPIPPKPYLEKSWHFDPATERSAVLAAKPDAKYHLLEATEKDKQKAVEHYQRHPVPGHEIGSVRVIYNKTFNTKFSLHLETLQEKSGNPVFAPKWPSMSNPGARQKTHSLLEQIGAPYTDPDYPAVKLIPAWHGTKPEIVDSIFRIGYSNLAFTDAGFFGKGLYSACEAEYSHRVYSKGALILNWVAFFSALPVIDGDLPMLAGQGNYGNYDAHFVPVVPQNPNKPNEVNYVPWNAQQKHTYTEVVVFETAACLPRYLVELQASGPQANKLNPLVTPNKPTQATVDNQKTQTINPSPLIKPLRQPLSLPPKKPTEQAEALYDYTTQDSQQLTFKKGDKITILEKTGDWWLGELKGKKGYVPSNYIQLVTEKKTPAFSFLPPPQLQKTTQPHNLSTQKDVASLLKWGTEGHLIEVEKLLKKNPQLALMTGTVTDLSDRTFNNITVFQYAAWALDIQMWNLILKYLDNSSALAQLQSLEAAPEKYSRHGAHYDITPLITKTREYLDNYSKWDYAKCCQHWQKEVGGAQRQCPAWLIYAWSEKGRDVAWVKKDLARMQFTRQYDQDLLKWWFTQEYDGGKGVGSNWSVVRGQSRGPDGVTSCVGGGCDSIYQSPWDVPGEPLGCANRWRHDHEVSQSVGRKCHEAVKGLKTHLENPSIHNSMSFK